MRILFAVLLLIWSTLVFAATLPVQNVVPDRPLTTQEQHFLATVPDGPVGSPVHGLRNACQEMLLAQVIHVPEGGVYRKGDSVRYWSMYQVWTAPKTVTLPEPPKPICESLPPPTPPTPPSPTVITVSRPQPPWLPAAAVDNGTKSIQTGAVGLLWRHKHSAPPKEEFCDPPWGPPQPDPPVPPPMELPRY